MRTQRKYGNTKVCFHGHTFDSRRELGRYLVLRDAQREGRITDLQCQVKFELIPAITEEYVEHLKTKDKVKTRTVQKAINYIADFTYKKGSETVVEDVKISESLLPKEFVLKEKLFRYKYGFPIRRVYKSTDPV